MNKNKILEQRYNSNVEYFNCLMDQILATSKYCGFCISYKDVFKARAKCALAGKLLYKEWGYALGGKTLMDIVFEIDNAFQECRDDLRKFENN